MTRFERIGLAAERAIGLLARGLGGLAALAVAGIVIVLLISSIQRYVLARPIPITEELAAYLFVAMAFLALPEGFTTGRQIRLLVLWQRLPRRVQGWATIAGQIGALVVLAFLVRQTWGFAASSHRFGSRSYVGNMLEWPWMMLLPFALAMLMLALAARVLVNLGLVLRGEIVVEARPQPEEPHP